MYTALTAENVQHAFQLACYGVTTLIALVSYFMLSVRT